MCTESWHALTEMLRDIAHAASRHKDMDVQWHVHQLCNSGI